MLWWLAETKLIPKRVCINESVSQLPVQDLLHSGLDHRNDDDLDKTSPQFSSLTSSTHNLDVRLTRIRGDTLLS